MGCTKGEIKQGWRMGLQVQVTGPRIRQCRLELQLCYAWAVWTRTNYLTSLNQFPHWDVMREKRANPHAVLRTVPGRQPAQINISYLIPGKTVLGGVRASSEGWKVKPRGLGVKKQRWTRLEKSGQGPRSAGGTHIGKGRLVMLVLNPRGYSQGSVQQLCKCQGAQEVISLVPEAPWMVYCERWGLGHWGHGECRAHKGCRDRAGKNQGSW